MNRQTETGVDKFSSPLRLTLDAPGSLRVPALASGRLDYNLFRKLKDLKYAFFISNCHRVHLREFRLSR